MSKSMTTPFGVERAGHGDVETVGVAVEVPALPGCHARWWAASKVKVHVTLVEGFGHGDRR